MSLDDACNQLGWPAPDAILAPTGAGPAVYADLARQKIQQSLQRFPGAQGVRVGVLMRDPTADATEEPVAVVCELQSSVSARTLEEAHRLAWNFCRSKIVVIVEPRLVRAWTCCEPPPKTPLLGALRWRPSSSHRQERHPSPAKPSSHFTGCDSCRGTSSSPTRSGSVMRAGRTGNSWRICGRSERSW